MVYSALFRCHVDGFMAYELLKVPQFKKKEPRFHADTFFDNIYDS